LQLDELQPQPRNPGDETMQRCLVSHVSDEHRVGRRLARIERFEGLEDPRGQPAGDPEAVVSGHVVLLSDGGTRTGTGAPDVIIGAVR
jgi:hypothetical protein